jgi:hypothetical protein
VARPRPERASRRVRWRRSLEGAAGVDVRGVETTRCSTRAEEIVQGHQAITHLDSPAGVSVPTDETRPHIRRTSGKRLGLGSSVGEHRFREPRRAWGRETEEKRTLPGTKWRIEGHPQRLAVGADGARSHSRADTLRHDIGVLPPAIPVIVQQRHHSELQGQFLDTRSAGTTHHEAEIDAIFVRMEPLSHGARFAYRQGARLEKRPPTRGRQGDGVRRNHAA